ncbi:hypothetical protein VHEMI10230 [[Torrubiella] hemipterigena]|uniref:Uncharacterized protein n=1 Tax=[Torrubiella] hemipterigena TaxID=1531966 RepID=A0A0A1TRU7_9HYPO|nr:hypothetical protein VHEMI10230 [[Torrubiella] hemipterigena]
MARRHSSECHHHCAKMEKTRIRQSPVDGPQAQFTRNHHYRQALVHFNKSIQHLITALPSRKSEMTYMQKEMVIMTNIIYIGICGMLEDDAQIHSHRINFVNLLEQLHFGDEDPSSRRGIMRFDDLLSIVLAIDGNIDAKGALRIRWDRNWVVQVPECPKFTSITQTYTQLLPFLYRSLDAKKATFGSGLDGPDRYKARRLLLEAYKVKLDAFEATRTPSINTTHDDNALKVINLFFRAFSLKESVASQPTRSDVIREEERIFPLLDELDDILSQGSSSRIEAYSEESPPMTFSLTPCALLDIILIFCSSAAARRKGIHLLKKWPHNNNGESSHDLVTLYSAHLAHELDAPRRTLEAQRTGEAMKPSFANGGLPEGVFDGHNSCECITELYVCRGHRMADVIMQNKGSQRYVGFRTHYEIRHKLPYTFYPLD